MRGRNSFLRPILPDQILLKAYGTWCLARVLMRRLRVVEGLGKERETAKLKASWLPRESSFARLKSRHMGIPIRYVEVLARRNEKRK